MINEDFFNIVICVTALLNIILNICYRASSFSGITNFVKEYCVFIPFNEPNSFVFLSPYLCFFMDLVTKVSFKNPMSSAVNIDHLNFFFKLINIIDFFNP